MVKLSEIIEFMERRFPLSYAMDFDNVGLLAGRAEGEAAKALLCLNCDKFVVDEAVRLGLTDGYTQEKSSAQEEYTPPFGLTGL